MELEGCDHVSMLSHPQLVLQRNQAPSRVRKFHIIASVSGKLRTLKINNASIDTLNTALLERMYFCKVGEGFFPPPQVSKTDVFECLRGFKSVLLRKFGQRPTKQTPEEFVEMFRGRKRKIYENALDEFYEYGVQRRHALSCAFVKCEKVNPNKAPRCIQPRHPVYNIGVGCYLKHIEHRLYNAISKTFGLRDVVAKGYNVEELGRIIERKFYSLPDVAAIGLDATKFDMHVSAEMLEWEHSIYLNLYGNDPELKRLLKMQVDNRGVGFCDNGKLRYKVRGRRFSGDMNTALGNCLIMCGMIWAYTRQRNIPVEFINNGDDCVVFMGQNRVSDFTMGLDQWFLRLGFRMTTEQPVTQLEEVEFCQMRPIHTIRGVVMCRNFDTAREKDSLCLFPLPTETAMRKWLWAVGECGLALCGGVPVMEAFYRCYMRNGVEGGVRNAVQMQSGMQFLADRLEAREYLITDDARVSFFIAWGYTPDEQRSLEQYYDSLTIDHTHNPVDNFVEIDSAPL